MAVLGLTGPRAPRVLAASATVLAVSAVAVGAVLADGYDAQELPRLETNIWVTRDHNQYARLNTELGELDTVRAVADPVSVLQSGPRSVVLTQGLSQAWAIDPAFPQDFVEAGSGESSGAVASPTPAGTGSVASAGDFILYLTDSGEVYLGSYPKPGDVQSGAWNVNPFADAEVEEGEEPPRYTANAAAIDDSGRVAMYSSAEKAVRIFDALNATFVGAEIPLPQPPGDDNEFAMSFADGRWVLFSPTDGRVWWEGGQAPVDTGLGGDALIQGNASPGDRVLFADAEGLTALSLRDGSVSQVVQASGNPAAPLILQGVGYAAWVDSGSATLWQENAQGVLDLTVPAGALDDIQAISPAFRSNGDRAVLTETSTGLLWMIPDGTLIPLDQWDPLEDDDESEGTVTVDDVVEQEPPVAVDDVLGVRRGAVTVLPLLYNDHDPNKKDVLTIAPGSLTGLSDSAFGDIRLASDNQVAVAAIAASEGTASFTYAVSDGNAQSDLATVTLTVIPDEVNSPPVWCGVQDCTQEPPSPQVSPGGYVSIPVLSGWVDPEGDVFALTAAYATDPNAPITVVPTAEGNVVIRHLDPNAGDSVIGLTITVTDAMGASTDAELELRVTSAPSLEVRPIALAAAAGEGRNISIADFVTGGSGSYRLLDAVASKGSTEFTVAPNVATGTIDLYAAAPGEYSATYTVEDAVTLAQQTATLRFSIAEQAGTLSLPPLVAFVRPQEDSTLDVLATAQNTTGRVLMVSSASTSAPGLSVNVVAEAYVRVSGSTADGLPGRIGTADVTVSDGAGTTATTQLTAFLLPPSHGVNPIAVPDTISVRAGTQVDVAVLDNDVSPRGERLLLMPEVEGSGTAGELAFSSGSSLRYLAPTVPGVYTLRYTTYLENDPGRFDTTTLTVTVLAPGSNRAPQPQTLTARVLAGQSVNIPLLATGLDPDGDAVYLSDVSQPRAGSGVASISAGGNALVYRAPAGGVPGGQATFEYTVTDSLGESATALVRVGVLNAELTDPSPITYTDYVAAQVGSDFPLEVEPLLNDRDPLRGNLRLLDLLPNATEGSEEYARLEALIGSDTSLEDGKVQLFPGDVQGTHSYVYRVESSSTLSVSQGLIVVGVSEDASPPQLRVTDTTVTARTRLDLATGIDVVTDKVQWATGDVAQLRLSVWGDAADTYEVNGRTISGPIPQKRTVVPFVLSGVDFAGEEVVTYGFLRIPPLSDMRLQRIVGAAPIEVGEEQSVEFDVRDILDINPRDTIEVRNDESFAVQRANSTCAPTRGTSVTYTAGREAPWSDTCSVAVRLEGQSTWSIVAIPLVIIPKDPQAILTPTSLTISPGQSQSLDLLDALVEWEGGRVGNESSLQMTTLYSGASFDVVHTGDQVSILAHADAKPGTRESISVASAAYGGLSTTIALVVGVAAPDAPRGATFSHQCDVSRGSSCLITVTGLPGEYDPFAGVTGSGLTVVSVGASGSVVCPVATVTRASDTQLVASWPSGPKPVGGECVASFTVADAQGRTGTGTVTLDILGYPQTPASITTVDYTGTSVTLLVNLGNATQAHPPVTSVVISRNGTPHPATCEPGGPGSYRCLVTGLVNGEKASYTARAVNSVGESLDTTSVQSWAFQAPTIATVTAQPQYHATLTTLTKGVVQAQVESSDDTQSFRIVNTGQTVSRTGPVTTFPVTLDVGAQQLEIIPISQFEPPMPGGNQGSARTASVTVIGAPSFGSPIAATPNGPEITVAGGTPNANYAPGTTRIWAAWTGGTPTCRMTATDGTGVAELTGPPAVTSASAVISGLAPNTNYKVGVCLSNGYGAVWSNIDEKFTWVDPGTPTGTLSYTIDVNPDSHPSQPHIFNYELSSGPSIDNPGSDYYVAYFYGSSSIPQESFSLSLDAAPSISVAYCAEDSPTLTCSTPAPIAATTVPTIVTVRFPDSCTGLPLASDIQISSAASGSAGKFFNPLTYEYQVTWGGEYSSLASITYPSECSIPPIVTPEPSDPPEPEDP